MNKPKTVVRGMGTACETAARMVGEDRRYLLPWRYFQFCMLHEPDTRRTCWLPEGFDK